MLAAITRLDRDRDGLLVFFVGVVLLRVAAAVYLLTDLLVAAAPVVVLACRIAIPSFTPFAMWGVVGQWGGASGAGCEDVRHPTIVILDGALVSFFAIATKQVFPSWQTD